MSQVSHRIPQTTVRLRLSAELSGCEAPRSAHQLSQLSTASVRPVDNHHLYAADGGVL